MSLPPPPPGPSDIPPPAASDHADIPPPAPEVEQYENDVLKRRKHFSWKKFGGEGFLVSVALHIILLVLGLFWIVNKWREPAKKPEEFSTGAGGGASGEKAKAFETKMKRVQPMIVKTPSRIVSKSANASVSLPSTPTTSTASFATGLAAGGMSKGSGGGSGGGEGTGIGIGKGGGKQLVTLFGARGATNGLSGYIYDFFQTREGKPNKNPQPGERAHHLDWVRPIVSKYIDGGWDDGQLSKYFRGPVALNATQILIPVSKDDTAPKAFFAEDKMKGGAWIAVYRGRVTAPETATIRFVGAADNFIAVRLDRKTVLAFDCGKKPSALFPVPGLRMSLVRGPWTEVRKGQSMDMAVLLGDGGGVFSASLTYEKKDQPGKLFLFRTEDTDFAPALQTDLQESRKYNYPTRDLPSNMDPNSPVWPCKATATSIR